jgi:hypothetical protein
VIGPDEEPEETVGLCRSRAEKASTVFGINVKAKGTPALLTRATSTVSTLPSEPL